MFKYNLVPVKYRNRLKLRFPLWGRIFFFAITFFFGLSLTFVIMDQSSSPVFAGILFLLALFSSCYSETWHFDPERNTITAKEGLFFIPKKRSESIDNLRCVFISEFTKGQTGDSELIENRKRLIQPRKLTRLSLEFNNDETWDIEILNSKEQHRMIRKGTRIAEFCGVDFIEKN